MTREELISILDEADKAYNEKRYQESIDLITKYLYESRGTTPDLNGRAQTRLGWNLYFIGLQENLRQREGIIDKPANLKEAIKVWQNVLEYEESPKFRISALNGLPLAVRFFDREKAYQWSDQGIQEAEESGDSALIFTAKNTRIPLLREDGRYPEAKRLAIEVLEGAMEVRDFRTAGHAQQNLGDTIRLELKNVQKTENERRFLFAEAYLVYRNAVLTYQLFEVETGQKAVAHIESAQKKAEECLKELRNFEES